MSDQEEKNEEDYVVCEELQRLQQHLEQGAQAIVFDCDGTLLDSMPLYWQSWDRSCQELGLKMTIDEMYAHAGVPVEDIFQQMIDEQLPDDPPNKPTIEHCVATKRKHHNHLAQHQGLTADPIPIVCEIVKQYHGKLPMAVASSGWRDHVLEGLERNHLLHYFDAVITADQVENPKPAPDIFLEAAKQLRVCPTKCIGLEDADLGLQSIQRAGFLYASDVRLLYHYPRNVEQRQHQQRQASIGDEEKC